MTRLYPAYRDSGVEWLGEVPSDWEVRPIKAAFQIVGGTTPKSEVPDHWDGTINWVTPADLSNLSSRYIYESGRKITESGLASCGTTIVPPNSIVLSVRAPIGSLAIAANEVCTNQGCKALVPDARTHTVFYFFVLDAARAALNNLGRGSTFLELSGDQLASFRVPLPPLAEQTVIAAFLDREMAKIDALVEEQRRLIDLLREKRQAVISHAVTRGLNPDAKLKPSGVDWLGDVPEGWEIDRFGRLIAISEGQVDPREEPYASMVLIAPNHVESGTGRLFTLETAAEQSAESGKYMFEQGAVIYSKIRPALAKVAIAPVAGLCSADMYPLTSRGKLQQDYLAWLLLSPGFTAWAVLESDRVAMPKINREKLNELRLPVPSLAEQEAIVDFIVEKTASFDQLSEQAEAAIALLQERRAALISAAVTGKIDVRHLVAEAEVA